MARLNIEDQFWIDIIALAVKMGDQDKAIGQAVRFLRFAQEKHRTGSVITPEDFVEQGFSDHLIGVFAQANPSGIQAKGSTKHFGWLDQRIAAASKGGKQSATRPRDAKGRLEPKRDPSTVQAKPTKSKPLTLPLTLKTLELSTSYLGESLPATTPPEIQNPVGYFIGTYRKAFQARYPNAQPDVRGKVQGQIKRFLDECPMDEAMKLIQVYCQMDGHRDWFKTKGHDFGTFIENLNPVRIALAQGFDPGRPAEPDWEKICRVSA